MGRNGRDKVETVEPVCIECGRLGVMTPGAQVYPRRPDLHARLFYVCPCGARVGCHPGTTEPLGLPCGPATALARDKAHRVFDPIWKRKVERGARKSRAREQAYKWLGEALGLPRERAHISHMDLATCRRVIDLCRPIAAKIAASRQAERGGGATQL